MLCAYRHYILLEVSTTVRSSRRFLVHLQDRARQVGRGAQHKRQPHCAEREHACWLGVGEGGAGARSDAGGVRADGKHGVRRHYIRRLVSFDGWGGVLVVQSRGHLWGCSCRHAASQQGRRRNESNAHPEAERRCSTVTRTKRVNCTQTKPLLQRGGEIAWGAASPDHAPRTTTDKMR